MAQNTSESKLTALLAVLNPLGTVSGMFIKWAASKLKINLP